MNKIPMTVISLALSASILGHAADEKDQIGVVLAAQGSVAGVADSKEARPLARKSPIFIHDSLQVGPQSKVQLRFSDGSLLSLAENTTFQVDKYQFKGNSDDQLLARLAKGGLRALPGAIDSSKTRGLSVETPVAVMGVTGTLFSVVYSDEAGLYVAFFQGSGWIKNKTRLLNLGQNASFDFGFQSTEDKTLPEGQLGESASFAALELRGPGGLVSSDDAVSPILLSENAVQRLSSSELRTLKEALEKRNGFDNNPIIRLEDLQVELRSEGIDCLPAP